MLSGENLGDFTMKQPSLKNLKIDKKGTELMRKKALASKKVKITINFDANVLDEVKKLAKRIGSPYQTFLNKLVRESVENNKAREDRLSRLEREVKALKRKVV